MEKWHIAANGYFGSASIGRQIGPWYSFAIESALWRVAHVLHRTVGRIPFPDWWNAREVVIPADGDWPEWQGSRGDYYGTHLEHRFHAWFEQPIFDWCYRRRKTASVELAFVDVAKAFSVGDTSDYWKTSWEDGTAMWQENGPPDPKHGKVWRTAESTLDL